MSIEHCFNRTKHVVIFFFLLLFFLFIVAGPAGEPQDSQRELRGASLQEDVLLLARLRTNVFFSKKRLLNYHLAAQSC